MSHRKIIEDCLAGTNPFRVPVVLWRHFPVDDQDPVNLADATISFQKTYDFDIVKVSPASSYCLNDWGIKDEWRGSTEGTRVYTSQVIRRTEDWAELNLLDPKKGYLGKQLKCLNLITRELGTDVPVIQTIFSPLSQAKNLVGKDELIIQLRQSPQAVHAGLKIIAESTLRFIEESVKTGIAGIFYAVQHGQYGLLTESEFDEFCRDYDLIVLEAVKSLWLNMLHMHGEHIMFDKILDYPVQVINWHDRETSPSLAEGLRKYQGVVCGGLRKDQTLLLGTPEQVKMEATDAVQSTGGKRFILGAGCVVPITTPRANLVAARRAVEGI